MFLRFKLFSKITAIPVTTLLSIFLCFNVGTLNIDLSQTTCTQADNTFVLEMYDGERPSEIYVVKGDGSHLVQLTNNTAGDFNPVWSPDGSKIAFVSDRDGNYEIYTFYPDGTAVQRLTVNNYSDDSPAWSPDGTKIAFISNPTGSNNDIYVMNADGTNRLNLTNDTSNDIFPTWSSNGDKIAFVSNRSGNYNLYTIGSTGSVAQQLTFFHDDHIPNRLEWSPDGSMIAFSGANEDIYRINVDGTHFFNITNASQDTGNFVWLDDSEHIVVYTTIEGLVLFRIDGAERLPLNSPLPEGGIGSFDVALKWLCGFYSTQRHI